MCKVYTAATQGVLEKQDEIVFDPSETHEKWEIYKMGFTETWSSTAVQNSGSLFLVMEKLITHSYWFHNAE